ncbi:MAG: methyltransferase domain-containing protein, partial [Oscillochloris sp.]|nr:methyltransferase domain-containing protein [Oscillochloris sp.]
DELAGRRMLDVGCGAGRLSIMGAHVAAESIGFDFSETAIMIAELNARATACNARFLVSDIATFCQQATSQYDVVTLVGVLEHVEDPLTTLRELHGIMSPGGVLVVSCPNFVNARGFSYMTLLTLLHLPMSLADLRQIDVMDMEAWCAETGFALERTVGAIYRFGWDEKAAEDMIKRLPLAVRDSRLDISFDFESYAAWQRKMVRPNHQLLTWLEAQGVLKPISRDLPVNMERIEGVDDQLWERMVQYMAEDISSDPYYCDVMPFATMGGEGIYLLRKLA